ncbi:anti-repressor SinI family protein [Oceanobacillus sp. CAU 1775]
MYANQIVSEVMLDQEWVSLIQEAKNIGLTIEQIRDFLTKENT